MGGAAFGGISTVIISYILFKATHLRYKSSHSLFNLVAVFILLILLPAAVFSGFKIESKAVENYNRQAQNIILFASENMVEEAKELLGKSYSDPSKKELFLRKANQLLQDSLKIQLEYHIISDNQLRPWELLPKEYLGLYRELSSMQ